MRETTKLFELPEAGNYVPQLQNCRMDDVPRVVHEVIFSQRRTDEVTKATLQRKPQVADFGEAGKTFVLAYHQSKMLEGYPTRDYAVFAVDVSRSDEFMGYGLSLLELDENNQEIGEPPFVQYTLTEGNYRDQGLAVRRLIVLNEANKAMFSQFLHSGTFAENGRAAEAAWQQLVNRNLAVKSDDGYYRFIK